MNGRIQLVDTAAANGPRTARWLAVIEALRPHQWLKNVLVFAPLLAAHRVNELGRLADASRCFVAFSLCASAVYLLNDLCDLESDRQHPHKRNRPIASGRLPAAVALLLVPLLLGAAAAAAPRDAGVIGVLALYVALMIAYSLRLKAVVLLDAFVLAGGYALRVVAGGLAVGIRPSAHLLAFCVFLFFSLALLKRHAELMLLGQRDGTAAHARAYRSTDRELLLPLGVSCGVLSVLVLALYLIDGRSGQSYARSQLIWASCALLLYWIAHVWLAADRGRMTDDPLVFALRDRVSLGLVALLGVSLWFAL